MKVTVLYCSPQVNAPVYQPAARAFAASYVQNPPGLTDHELVVGLNGGEKQPIHDKLFAPLAPTFITHNNWGRDVGLFQHAADRLDCDLLVCFGSHVEFHLPNWLDIMVNAYLENGPSLYGAWGFREPAVHIRTTAFWMPPELFRLYPYQIGDPQRYAFEHGPESITLWTKSKGFEPMMVTRRGVFGIDRWHHVEREDCLFLDQHARRIGY